MLNRRTVLASALAIGSVSKEIAAQPSSQPLRIGWVAAQRPAGLAPYVEAFRTALAGLGYVEGRNLQLHLRYGEDDVSRVPALAAELLRLPVDIIIGQGQAVPIIAAMALPVPGLFAYSGDPVLAGFAKSLSNPGGNMTGVTFLSVELNGKRLELLREFMPGLRRVAIVANPEHHGEQRERAYSEETARQLGLGMQYFPTRTQDDLNKAFAAMAADPPQALSVFSDGFAVQNRQAIIDFGMRVRAPVISGWPVFVESGALCSYGPRLVDSYRRLASYVDRIVKGAKPADLPIEQPTQFAMVVNLKTAKALGITVPQSVLLRADSVIQ